MPCKFADIAPCKKQLINENYRHKTGFRCNFYDSFAKRCPAERPDIFTTTEVVLLDSNDHPVKGTQVNALIDGEPYEASTNENGTAKLQHLKSAKICEVSFSHYPSGTWYPVDK